MLIESPGSLRDPELIAAIPAGLNLPIAWDTNLG